MQFTEDQAGHNSDAFFCFCCLLLHPVGSTMDTGTRNPARSRLWICPQVLTLLRFKVVSFALTEFCMWGQAWRKTTCLASYDLDLSQLAERRCVGSKRGLCKRTNKPHGDLAGLNEHGQWVASVAEPYPKPMCSCSAKPTATLMYKGWQTFLR